MDAISYDEFRKVDLRTARIEGAEPVQGTDKLVRLEIDIGEEKRTLVAGIRANYSPEDLVGKSIVVVTNLQPRKIKGIESRGMLLAVEDESGIHLLTVDAETKPGLRVL